MFRIAQITDLHLLPETGTMLYGVDTAVALEKVLRDMTSLSHPPELIIATGDLAEDGSSATYTRLRKILDEANVPTYVLPGNHDDSAEMRTCLTSEVVRFERLANKRGWAIVLVDSHVERKDYGHVADAELRVLERNLDTAGDLPVVVALHHTPDPRCPASDCQLTNANELIELLGRHPKVKCVIAGHTHTTVDHEREGLRLFTTPSTFAQVTHAQPGEAVDHEDFWASHQLDGTRHGYRLLDLLPDGEVRSEVRWVCND